MTKLLNTLTAALLLATICLPSIAAEAPAQQAALDQPTTLAQTAETKTDTQVQQTLCECCGFPAASCDCAAEPSCGCQEPCCADPNACCQAKLKVGKRATRVCDPDCYECRSDTKQEEVEKHCYNVCAEPICIPKFRWPWECCKKKSRDGCDCGDCDSCCSDDSCTCCTTAKCGKIRCINKLEKEKYKCDACVTKWKAVRKGCACCDGGCCGNGCCAETSKASDVVTVSAEEAIAKKAVAEQAEAEPTEISDTRALPWVTKGCRR